ncbi:amidohydrolase [Labrys monachus]|uniref:Amidohydrolase YtcJ n=1 Tax=Labrys monachus TaxID=217067 RepID=A0ABU0FE56_9HYPH|nr:amidohydrolase [Labrys monachus]MDQ0392891.1 putative amidohydrolase YtcJ [Labrys monachus]
MCIGCDWGTYRDIFAGSSHEIGPLRRQGLIKGAAFAASAVVAAASAAPIFAADIVAGSDPSADIVFRNGPVYTVARDTPWAGAVAVKGKRIVYVGDDAGVQAYIGARTRVVDLAGKMLLPGFVEGHIHPLVGATLTRGVNLPFDTHEETLATLKAYRDEIGTVDIVRGYGWRYCAFPAAGPRKEDLDAIWPNTPAFLIAIDGHSAWANSKMLTLAGVTRDTKDPLPGFSFFQRDATGVPTGYLVEVPAELMVNNAVEPFSAEYVATSLTEWLPEASAAGITTLFDAGMQVVPEADGFAIYDELEREEKLPFRVVGSYYHNNPAIDPVPLIQALHREFNSELVKASVLKLNIDGGDAQRTAAFFAPYADAPETSGDTLLPPPLFADIIRRADREGIDIHIHSYGDRATHLSLDAFEAAIEANPPRDRRNTIAHLFLVSPDDIPRFAKLGVVAQFSAQWAVPDASQAVTRARLGLPRSNELYPWGSIHRAGGVLSLGTDWPAAGYYSTFRPLEAIEVATTRRELGKPNGPPLAPADEVVPLDVALSAATMGPAWELGMEREIGSIEVGKLADLIVLERNLFEVSPDQIHRTKVLMTVMNGRLRHEHGA